MNKWQLICPLVAALVFAVVAGAIHFHNHDKGLRAAIERDLGGLLTELAKHPESGRFPSNQTVSVILNDETLQATSMFGTGDLLYNPSHPVIGSDDVVMCARFGERLFTIRANREVREIGKRDLRNANLIPLTQGAVTNVSIPGDRAIGNQPIRSVTNQSPSPTGSRP